MSFITIYSFAIKVVVSYSQGNPSKVVLKTAEGPFLRLYIPGGTAEALCLIDFGKYCVYIRIHLKSFKPSDNEFSDAFPSYAFKSTLVCKVRLQYSRHLMLQLI